MTDQKKKKFLVDDWKEAPKWASIHVGAAISTLIAGLLADPTVLVTTAQLVIQVYKQLPDSLHAVVPVSTFAVFFGLMLLARLWRQGQD